MDESLKLDKLVKKANRRLFQLSSVFPFDFFPNTIRVDENKVDVVYRQFFFNKHIVSILIKDINTVILSSGVFFASLHIQLNKPPPPGNDVFLGRPVTYLWKKDAIRARRIIIGLVAANEEKVDLSEIPPEQLVFKIEEIGKSREFTRV